MMIEVKLQDAEGHLEQLIEEAAAGEEVVITSASGSAVRFVALPKGDRSKPVASSKVIGHAMDHFIGTWSAEQAAELLKAIEVFEQVDESFWT
jgi:antitoxin (DNA-binding transcriptional repressor) of toxin-antitoxin stability system